MNMEERRSIAVTKNLKDSTKKTKYILNLSPALISTGADFKKILRVSLHILLQNCTKVSPGKGRHHFWIANYILLST